MKKYNFLLLNVLKKKKLCRFSIRMFTIMIISYISILGLSNGIENKYNDIKNKYIIDSYTTISSSKEYSDMVSDIEKTKLAKKYYPLMHYQNDTTEFIYIDDNIIDIKYGSYINSENEVIVSKSMNLNINDTINVHINDYEYKLTVAGIYDDINYNISMNHQINNSIICSYDFLYSIIDLNNIHEIVVQINDYDNVDNFLKKIHSYGSYDSIINDKNSNILNRYKGFSNGMVNLSKIVMLFIILFVGIINYVIINDNIIDIAILKSFGYSNMATTILIFTYSLLLLLISLVPGITISLMLLLLSNNLIVLKMSMIIKCVLSFAIIDLLVLSFFYYYIRKINIIKLIKS